MVKAHIIIIGDELLDGTIQDIHVKKQAKWLTQIGVHLGSVSFCRDIDEDLLRQLQFARDNSQIIITTGGLGPTIDDKTKYILAKFLGKPLKENDKAKQIAIHNYNRIDKQWQQKLSNYHLIPSGVAALDNPVGLAPGLHYEDEQSLILCAPGVPRELYAMSEKVFTPIIIERFKENLTVFNQFVVRTHSIPEEKIFISHGPSFWQELEKYGKVSSLPQSSGVDIRITLKAQDSIDIDKDIKSLKDIFEKSLIKDNIWQYGDHSLEEYILKKCREKSLTLSIAESCTGGFVSSLFTDISGYSDVFMGSAVTYSNESKIKILNVKSSTIEKYGAVSKEVAQEMAIGSLENYQGHVAVSYSGIAGPSGGSKEKPVGTVAIGLASRTKSESNVYQFHGSRTSLKKKFAIRGLMDLLKYIESI